MPSEIKELDVRPIIAKEKHSTIFATFEALASGEAFQLINDHDPKPLYYEMEAERKGTFEWEYVEKGTEVWRVNIKKIA